jgi:DNA-binding XRE family transcriptional regulator
MPMLLRGKSIYWDIFGNALFAYQNHKLYVILSIKPFNAYGNEQRSFMRTAPPLPLPVKRALTKIGDDLKAARTRRRLTATMVAERAFITRSTLTKVERGDPGVSLGIYATVLFVLGLSDRLEQLADIRSDDLGLQLDDERRPKRVRSRGRKDS